MPRSNDLVQGAEVVAKNIVKFTQRFLQEVNVDMSEVALLLRQAIQKNISLTDHSLSELAKMGHPYGRHYSGSPIHNPSYQVHSQTGALLRTLVSGTEAASVSGGGSLTASAYAGVSGEKDYAVMVIKGTSKMVPRDFLKGSLNEVRNQVKDILSRSLRGAVVGFNGEKVQL